MISRQQALATGLTRHMIETRVGTGRWIRLDPAVYAFASHPFTWHRQVMAAVLSVDGALASGRTAARLHQFPGFGTGRPEITAPPGRNERSRLAVVHRSAFIRPAVVDHIPCANITHTVFALAPHLRLHRLGRLVDELLVARAVDIEDLLDVFVPFAAGRRPGTRLLRAILDERSAAAYVPPESELERRLYDLVDHPALPRFRRQIQLPWWPDGEGRVDAYSPECTLIVEADGRRWHTRERDFVRDRQRDNLATAHGHAVLRFTYRDLTVSPGDCLALIEQTAVARGWPNPAPTLSRA